ncbi:MAG: zinc ABC transporter substrate-binding protein [Clostridia bacterium]|nr:zinc ABC transporter substrate-binding protein [Clostridia bacterium]
MKSFRRIVPLLLCALLALSALACGKPASETHKPKVVVTIFPQYDFIRRIAGDRVELQMLAKPGSEVHGFDPSMKEMSEILEADLFVYVGGETDRWVDDLLRTNGAGLNTVALIDLVDTVDEEIPEGMQGDAEENPAPDEHVWTSPKNAIAITEGLCGKLCELLPEEADAIRENTAAFVSELEQLDEEFHAVVRNAKRKTVVFAERFPFRYLCDELGLAYYAALPGCSSNEEVALSTVSFLIETVREQNVPGVFYIEFSDRKIANTIADATGCETWLLHSCHNVSKEDFDAGVTYLDLMRQNLENLKKAVN